MSWTSQPTTREIEGMPEKCGAYHHSVKSNNGRKEKEKVPRFPLQIPESVYSCPFAHSMPQLLLKNPYGRVLKRRFEFWVQNCLLPSQIALNAFSNDS